MTHPIAQSLRIKAGMMTMGEQTNWSDTIATLQSAADLIDSLTAPLPADIAEIERRDRECTVAPYIDDSKAVIFGKDAIRDRTTTLAAYRAKCAEVKEAVERTRPRDELISYLLTRCARDQWVTDSSLGLDNEHIKVLRFSDYDDMRVGRMMMEISGEGAPAIRARAAREG